MNNNNRGNNRRRGRGNNNRPQGGNQQQVNRIDSRARGNAPQLLEKYRKLAHDAHLNGDRVNAEYYLQFADHYFRVLADTRLRQEEARARRDDRWQEPGEGYRDEGDESGDFSVESDFPAFDQPPVYTRPNREERPRDDRPTGDRQDRRDERPRDDRSRDDRPSENDIEPGNEADDGAQDYGDAGSRSIYEPAENPFVRDGKGPRTPRPRRDNGGRDDARRDEGRPAERRPRRDNAAQDRSENHDVLRETPNELPTAVGLDPMSLPPAISAGRRGEEEPSEDVAAKPARKPRARRKPASDAGEPLESVS